MRRQSGRATNLELVAGRLLDCYLRSVLQLCGWTGSETIWRSPLGDDLRPQRFCECCVRPFPTGVIPTASPRCRSALWGYAPLWRM